MLEEEVILRSNSAEAEISISDMKFQLIKQTSTQLASLLS